jgi:hypothetical protein
MSLWTTLLKGIKDGPSPSVAMAEDVDWLRRAEENPRLPLVRQRAGDELARQGDTVGAVRHWIAAADLYMSQGFTVRALALLVGILKLDPENAEVPSRIAKIARDEDLVGSRGPDLTIRTRLRAWTPLFSDFSRDDLAEIIRQMTVHRFEAGDTLLRTGEFAEGLSVIMEGTVRIVTQDAHGGEALIGRLHHGDFFGESSVLLDLPTPATLVAETGGELLRWPRAAFDESCARRPGLREILERFREERANMAVEAAVARFHSVS